MKQGAWEVRTLRPPLKECRGIIAMDNQSFNRTQDDRDDAEFVRLNRICVYYVMLPVSVLFIVASMVGLVPS